jgi:hypothetical protein
MNSPEVRGGRSRNRAVIVARLRWPSRFGPLPAARVCSESPWSGPSCRYGVAPLASIGFAEALAGRRRIVRRLAGKRQTEALQHFVEPQRAGSSRPPPPQHRAWRRLLSPPIPAAPLRRPNGYKAFLTAAKLDLTNDVLLRGSSLLFLSRSAILKHNRASKCRIRVSLILDARQESRWSEYGLGPGRRRIALQLSRVLERNCLCSCRDFLDAA